MLTGSRCGPALAERIEKKLNCKLINMYGLKEGANVITMTRPDDSDYVRRYSEGRPVPGVEIKIVDENRVEVPRGEVGELTFRGYNMLGYHRRPAKNAAYADAGGWIYTGDMAKYLDGENITIVGRKRDRITHGGFDIYPGEIEECVLQIPQVQSAAAVAAAENINVFVIPKAGAAVNSDEILAHLSQNLADYMQPDDVRFVSGMPSLLTGTIDKKALADWSENGVPPEYGIFFT
jgi:fatty-acyl-CoA synthase